MHYILKLHFEMTIQNAKSNEFVQQHPLLYN